MKIVRLAYALLILSLLFVATNSFILTNLISETIAEIDDGKDESAELALEKYTRVYEKFRNKEKYISLTVNHTDISGVDAAFAEMIGAAEAGDLTSVITIKSRLRDSLDHLRRLCGINFYSIF